MADDIQQAFSIDASGALKALEALNTNFDKLTQTLSGADSFFKSYNAGADTTISKLRDMEAAARSAAAEMAKVGKIRVPQNNVGARNTGSGGGAQQKLLQGNDAADALNSLLGDTATKARTAERALGVVGSAAEKSMGQGRRATSGFAISFETLVRIVSTQVVIRAMNAIRNAVESSIQGFIDFNRAIAEIQTIAPSNEGPAELAKQVRELSDAFNAPILDVAKAKYEAISTNFAETSESTKVMTAALKFSKVALASTAESVDLIASSLNAFGKSADEAESVAAKFFEVINVGRIIGSELANSIGRVAPIANQAGISLEEVGAAFSSITIGGVKAAEAATQIRASIASIIKPSTAMKEALQSLGFETAEQIFAAKGYQGALLALIGTTDGSSASVAKLFPNIRALNGVIRETTTGLKVYQEHLERIKQANVALLNQKVDLRLNSDAERVSADFNKLKNFFTVELGQSLVKTISDISRLVGGVGTLTKTISALAPVILVTGVAITAFAALTTTATFVMNTFSASAYAAAPALTVFKGALLSVIAVYAAFQVGKQIGERLKESFASSLVEAKAASSKVLDLQKAQAAAQHDLDRDKEQTHKRLQLEELAQARKNVLARIDGAKEGNEQLVSDNKSTLDKLIAARAKYATDLQRASTTAENDITQSKKRNVDLQSELDVLLFNRRLNQIAGTSSKADQAYRADAQRSQALRIANDAASKLGGANTPDQKAAGDSAFAVAEAYAKQSIESAKASGNIQAQEDAERALEFIIRKKIGAEEEYQATRRRTAAQLEKAAADERKRVTDLQDLEKKFLDKSSVLGKDKKLKDGKTLEADKKDALQILGQLKEKLFGEGSKFDLSDVLGYDKLEKQLTQNVTKLEIDTTFNTTPQELAKYRSQLQGALEDIEVIIKLVPDKSKLEGLNASEQIDEAERQINEQDADIEAISSARKKYLENEREILTTLKNQREFLNRDKGWFESWLENRRRGDLKPEHWVSPEQKATNKEVDALLAKARTAANSPISEKTLAELEKLALALKERTGDIHSPTTDALANFIDDYRALVALTKENNAITAKFPHAETDLHNLRADQSDAADSAAEAAARREAAEAARKAETATQGASTSAANMTGSLASLVSQSGQYADNMQRAAQASLGGLSFPSAPDSAGSNFSSGSNGSEVYASAGGVMATPTQYFDSGGFAKGMDTINARLAPREMVMNQDASTKWFSQLQAMNAGHAPSSNRSQSGGGNLTIGDVHINGAQSPQATAREVIQMIRREQRRGSGNSLR